MALDKSDLIAIRSLMREELQPIETSIAEFRIQVDAQFTEVQSNFEGLYSRDEKREQEYLLLRQQIARLEERVDVIEKKVA